MCGGLRGSIIPRHFGEIILVLELQPQVFRVFVPLLALSAAAVVGHIDLPTNFDWIESPQALAVFAVACALEISGYYPLV